MHYFEQTHTNHADEFSAEKHEPSKFVIGASLMNLDNIVQFIQKKMSVCSAKIDQLLF